MSTSIYLKQLELGPMQNFIYIVGDPKTREAVVVDPGWEISSIVEAVKEDGYKLTQAFLTHHHFDHVQGLDELVEEVPVPALINRQDAPFLSVASKDINLLDDGDTVSIGSLKAKAVHTPGHTPGSQCLLIEGLLITGDTLFVCGCGRCDLPGGDPVRMYDTLHNTIGSLDEATKVYPGHNYGSVAYSTICDEKKNNPYLRPSSLEEFLSVRMGI